MLYRFILVAALFCISVSAFTQRTIKGTVFNEEDEPLINATVVLLSPVDSTMKYFGVTNKNGLYQIKNIRDGNYIMQFSFVGSELLNEDLLKKIPGIEVDVSGNIKALGEEVTKVLVDGKEFFGSDKKVAVKNLPADAIDKVEVYDKKSYEAEFTRIDDGVRDRTINLELLEEAKAGNLGNLEVGAGQENV